MKCHALEGAAVGAAGGLAILSLGLPVLAPVALIVGLIAGIRKDNEDVREERRRIAQEQEESDSNEDDENTTSNYQRHITMSPEIAAILQRINERPWQPNRQTRIAARDFNFTPFRKVNEDEDEDTPRFINNNNNNNNEERRPRRNIDSTEEPSLRNEEYFRRHGKQRSVDE